MIEATFRTYVLAGTTLKAITTRMYPLKLPQSPTLPAIVYTKVSGFREHDMDGSSIATPRIQFDCYAATYAAAKALADALRERADSYTGVVGSPADTVHYAYLLNEQDFYEDDTKYFRVSMDFEIAHNE